MKRKQLGEKIKFRIIIIDDNPAIHQDFIKILTPIENTGDLNFLEEKLFGKENKEEIHFPHFSIDTAIQGKEGFEKIKVGLKNRTPYALAFVDMRMPPGWDGIETIKNIWEVDPNIQVVICTAYSDYNWEETVEKLGVSANLLILKKPFDNTAVRQLATALTKKWDLMRQVKSQMLLLEQKVEERTASLHYSLSLTRSTLESSNDGIIVINNKGKVIDFNKRFTDLWQIPLSEKTVTEFDEVLKCMAVQLSKPQEYLKAIKTIAQDQEKVDICLLGFKDDRIFEQYTQPQKLEEKTIGRVLSFRDVTERIHLEKQLEIQATHDSLTGLPNRVLLYDRIQQATIQAKRNDQIVGILFFDLDRFKLVNDSFDHQVGDELLKAIAMRLQSVLREEDTIARQGGDEFVIVIPRLKNEAEITKVVRKLLDVFKKPFIIAKRNITIGASVGITFYPRDGITTEILLRNADLAMYRAKGLGGNQFQLYSPELNQKTLTRLEIENEMHQALERQEFYLCYQPELNIDTSKIIAAEALIRWNNPKRGLVLPNDFIPIAEESGLIIPIGEWVLREACRQSKRWQENGFPTFHIGVNVSGQQLQFDGFVGVIKKILKETGLEPQYLEIEVTENVIINNPGIAQKINEISKIGVRIALDDFGTGNSILGNLNKIHVDRLKIDQSFIQNINIDNNDELIIQAIIDMSHSLKYAVLAEGVETKQQFDFLKQMKCDVIQGFYFGKALDKEDFEKFIRIIHKSFPY